MRFQSICTWRIASGRTSIVLYSSLLYVSCRLSVWMSVCLCLCLSVFVSMPQCVLNAWWYCHVICYISYSLRTTVCQVAKLDSSASNIIFSLLKTNRKIRLHLILHRTIGLTGYGTIRLTDKRTGVRGGCYGKACPHWQQIVAENGNKSATNCLLPFLATICCRKWQQSCQCGQAYGGGVVWWLARWLRSTYS